MFVENTNTDNLEYYRVKLFKFILDGTKKEKTAP